MVSHGFTQGSGNASWHRAEFCDPGRIVKKQMGCLWDIWEEITSFQCTRLGFFYLSVSFSVSPLSFLLPLSYIVFIAQMVFISN